MGNHQSKNLPKERNGSSSPRRVLKPFALNSAVSNGRKKHFRVGSITGLRTFFAYRPQPFSKSKKSYQDLDGESATTTSDYVKGVPWCGIKTNCKCVCHLILDERYWDIDSNTKDAIEDRVNKIKADLSTLIGDRKKLEEFDNAIEALVRCREHSSYNAMPSVQTHEAVKELLGLMKHKQRNLYTEQQKSGACILPSMLESPTGNRQEKKKAQCKKSKKARPRIEGYTNDILHVLFSRTHL
ncbi:hypothetical protein BGZ49_009641 [Haplosporangium sp. Z 27]|nr:hypothetical protein BGZ49_009641 [Haplosporangium sp. Z 27]